MKTPAFEVKKYDLQTVTLPMFSCTRVHVYMVLNILYDDNIVFLVLDGQGVMQDVRYDNTILTKFTIMFTFHREFS